jgi:hypothetical protein
MKVLTILGPMSLAGLLASAPSVANPSDDQYTYDHVLFLTGYIVERAPKAGEMMQRRQEMCNVWPLASDALQLAMMDAQTAKLVGMAELDPGLANLINRVEFALNMAGIDIFGDFAQHLDAVEKALCENDDESYFGHFTITYAYCRMTMETGAQTLDIHMPPGGTSAFMQAVDLAKGEGVQVDLARDLAGTLPVTGAGWSSGMSMTPDGQTQEWLGYETQHYKYSFSAGMGGAGAVPAMDWVARKISVDNEGSAWVAPEVKGDSIPRRFYLNLASQVQPQEGLAGFFGGLILSNVGMLRYGLPLFVESKVTSRISGKSVISSDSQALITGVSIKPMSAGYCEKAIVPPDIEITNVSEEIQKAFASVSPEQMEQMQEAMAGMSPQQLEMMQNMGLGDMLGMGAAAGGSAIPQAMQQSEATSSPAPAPAAKKGSQDSLSAALQGANLAETAKNYLQVLGYDTGAGGGEMNIETTIAISQFQAENGMEATGEVTPQLIGLLAAKVDAL